MQSGWTAGAWCVGNQQVGRWGSTSREWDKVRLGRLVELRSLDSRAHTFSLSSRKWELHTTSSFSRNATLQDPLRGRAGQHLSEGNSARIKSGASGGIQGAPSIVNEGSETSTQAAWLMTQSCWHQKLLTCRAEGCQCR